MKNARRFATLLCCMTAACLLLNQPLIACSCIPRTLREQYDIATTVFVGTVTKVHTHYIAYYYEQIKSVIMDDTREIPDWQIEFTVQTTFKGTPGETIVITTDMPIGACPLNFREGETWVVFGVKQADGTTITNACWATGLLERMKPVVSDLTTWSSECKE